MTFMLEGGVFITHILIWVKVKVLANIQCCISTRKTPLHEEKKFKEYRQILC